VGRSLENVGGGGGGGGWWGGGGGGGGGGVDCAREEQREKHRALTKARKKTSFKIAKKQTNLLTFIALLMSGS
jgi:hypothetical protein